MKKNAPRTKDCASEAMSEPTTSHPHNVMRFREIPRAGGSVGDRGVDQDHHRDEEAAITRNKNDAGNRGLNHDAAL